MATPTTVPVQAIPQGVAVIIDPAMPQAERDTLRADLQHACGHDRFALLPTANGGIVAPAALQAALTASLGDAIRADLIKEARAVAATTASEAIAQSGGHIIGPQ